MQQLFQHLYLSNECHHREVQKLRRRRLRHRLELQRVLEYHLLIEFLLQQLGFRGNLKFHGRRALR